MERRRSRPFGDDAEIWHAVPKGAEVDADWCPIVCGAGEYGIVCHGGVKAHEVTCPECLAALA